MLYGLVAEVDYIIKVAEILRHFHRTIGEIVWKYHCVLCFNDRR